MKRLISTPEFGSAGKFRIPNAMQAGIRSGLLAILAGTALVACGGGDGGATTTTQSPASPAGSGTLRVALTDAPACGFDQVNVTIERVRVHQSSTAGDNDGGWVDIPVVNGPRKVDLLALTNGVLMELGTDHPDGRVLLADPTRAGIEQVGDDVQHGQAHGRLRDRDGHAERSAERPQADQRFHRRARCGDGHRPGLRRVQVHRPARQRLVRAEARDHDDSAHAHCDRRVRTDRADGRDRHCAEERRRPEGDPAGHERLLRSGAARSFEGTV